MYIARGKAGSRITNHTRQGRARASEAFQQLSFFYLTGRHENYAHAFTQLVLLFSFSSFSLRAPYLTKKRAVANAETLMLVCLMLVPAGAHRLQLVSKVRPNEGEPEYSYSTQYCPTQSLLHQGSRPSSAAEGSQYFQRARRVRLAACTKPRVKKGRD